MTNKVSEAINNVHMNYCDLVAVATDTLKPIIEPIDALISDLTNNLNNLSIDQIRDYILKLQLKAYEVSEIKEKSIMKSELSEALQKERFALAFNQTDGSSTAKSNFALLESSPELVSKIFYELLSGMLKNKVDQLHRLVDALKSVLMSRMQETKFMNIGTSAEIDKTFGVQYAQVTKKD